jgi:hypothetical protein
MEEVPAMIELALLQVSLAACVESLFQVANLQSFLLAIRFGAVQLMLSFLLAILNYPFLYNLTDVVC